MCHAWLTIVRLADCEICGSYVCLHVLRHRRRDITVVPLSELFLLAVKREVVIYICAVAKRIELDTMIFFHGVTRTVRGTSLHDQPPHTAT